MFEGRDLRRLGREGLRRLRGPQHRHRAASGHEPAQPHDAGHHAGDRVRRRHARRSGRSRAGRHQDGRHRDGQRPPGRCGGRRRRAGRHQGRTHRTGTRRPRPRGDSPRPPPGIPARTEWRAAPAGRAGDGHPEPAAAADRRRTHHRARRGHAVGDPRPPGRTARRVPLRRAAHLPRPAARGGQGGRPGDHVRRAHRRAGRHPLRARAAAAPLHPPSHRRRGNRDRAAAPTEAHRGEPPDPRQLPEGCAFAPRCPHRSAICTAEDPQLRPVDGATVACHHAPLEVSTRSNTGGDTWSDVGGDTGGGSERGTGRGAPSGTGTDDHPGTHTEATS